MGEGGLDMVEPRRSAVGTVRDWMTRHPVSVSPHTPISHVAGLMRANRIRHVLVVEGERLVGIVSEGDVRGLLVEGQPTVSATSPVRHVMSEPPLTVTPGMLLIDASWEMLNRKLGALPVLDDERPVGILSITDALEALLRWVDYGGTGPRP
jgi:CBS domain-containing protein